MGIHERTFSESSDSDFVIRPLELEDLKRRLSYAEEEENDVLQKNTNLFFSAAVGKKRIRHVTMPTEDRSALVKIAWKNAAKKALAMEDPWKKFNLADYPTETAKRHRYNALKQCWVEDKVEVKVEKISFNHGAMRECFRMKKLSNFSKVDEWSKALNYVVKSYMSSNVERKTYFDDVKLQMDAKLWGEEFNRHNPPKKVDIFQMAILEMINRPGSPLFHVEHFIEGKYVKYNSNSGFVKSESLRMTPQAFSHFTFERSGHELIVVDIQGVGDLYTDPQVHTAAGKEYGDGNLGTRGMALFFHSHICNSICHSLSLTQFDLFSTEVKDCKEITKAQKNCKTVVRGTEEAVVLPSEIECEDIQKYIRIRSMSSGYISTEERERIDSICSLGSEDSVEDQIECNILSDSDDTGISTNFQSEMNNRYLKRRVRYDSISNCGESTETKASDLSLFSDMVKRKARPSHILGQDEHEQLLMALQEDNQVDCSSIKSRQEHPILGALHLDLAKYHELRRFVEENESYDRDAAFFHLSCAAECGNLEAQIAMAQIHMGCVHDVLPELELDVDMRDSDAGFNYLISAAEAGDRASMITLAKAFDTGRGLPAKLSIDWVKAVRWYGDAVAKISSDREGNFDSTMSDCDYQIVARQAQMYCQGEYGLAKDPNQAGELFTEAADLATAAMKGKMAAKYYCLAEEAWAEMEE